MIVVIGVVVVGESFVEFDIEGCGARYYRPF
jgi:hypothetical protein